MRTHSPVRNSPIGAVSAAAGACSPARRALAIGTALGSDPMLATAHGALTKLEGLTPYETREQHARPAERHPRGELQPLPARPHGHPGAGRPGRRRDRGRGLGRGLAAPLGRRRHLARRPERVAPVRQPQQAQRGHRSQVGEGPRARSAPRRHRRRGGGELPAGGDGEARARLRCAEGTQAQPHLRVGFGLRPRRPLRREARPGPARASPPSSMPRRPAMDPMARTWRSRGRTFWRKRCSA